jgi:hypothetical protein
MFEDKKGYSVGFRVPETNLFDVQDTIIIERVSLMDAVAVYHYLSGGGLHPIDVIQSIIEENSK